MANVIINDTHLVNIANAIREKNGLSDTYTPGAMATAISAIETGGGDLPEEAYKITGNCSYRFANGGWDWFIEQYGDKITTVDISNCNYMFFNNFFEEIPFDLNISNSVKSFERLFDACKNLTTIPKVNYTPTDHMKFDFMFSDCYKIQELPEWLGDLMEIEANLSGANTNWAPWSKMFGNCYSLRQIPDKVMKNIKNPNNTSSYYSVAYSTPFVHCRALDELVNVYCDECEFTSNQFSGFFDGLSRVKDITFATEEDGSPCVRNWKNQTIDLTQYIGYTKGNILFTYISTDKKVETDEDYQALKNDPDWYTQDIAYSRYNHDSAVATINSLPDTSGSGGTNTIKFTGASGSKTDGGAINTLTDEEIAVAAAKGWTVSLV